MLKYKGIRKDWVHEDEEVIAECWIAMQKAINNFGRLNKIPGRRAGEFDDYNIEYDYAKKGFFAYLRKVVDRHLYRVYEKRYSRGETEALYDATGQDVAAEMRAADDPSDILPNEYEFGFTEAERLVYTSRVNNVPLSRFLRLYAMTQSEYSALLDGVRKKVRHAIG